MKIKPFEGASFASIHLSGSKSITNRVLLYSSLAEGETELKNVLKSEDTEIMQTALAQFGVKIENGVVFGTNGNFIEGDLEIFCGNAGTATRFLVAIAALRKGKTYFSGKERMHSRPIESLINALSDLGVQVESVNNNNCLPLVVQGTGKIAGGKVKMRGDLSSQYFSALLALAPFAEKEVEIEIIGELVSKPYLDMTIALLNKFCVQVELSEPYLRIKPQKYVSPKIFEIEGDASSASHLLSITTASGGYLELFPLSPDSVQGDTFFAEKVLTKMGAKTHFEGNKLIFEKEKGRLQALGEINLEDMPDAAMNAVVLASLAEGKSLIKGLSTLRNKETDRISALCIELKKMGANITEGEDFIEINGGKKLKGAQIETYDDHRMAMSFAVLGAVTEDLDILEPECVVKTLPNFWEIFEKMRPKKNLALTGMRCAGKTEYGKIIAKKWGWEFFDTDLYIQEQAGKTINEIVDEKGWDYFRDLEYEACKMASEKEKTVIALGGGAITFERNQELLKNSLKVFLKTPLNVLCERIAEKSDRPSLTGTNYVEEMEKIWEQRKEIYLNISDLVVELAGEDIGQDEKKLLTKLNKFYKIVSFVS